MKVAIVYNRESQKVINLLGTPNRERYGKKSIKRITAALEAGGHQVATFEGDKDLIDNLEEFMPRVIRGERPGMVFNLAYGIQGQARYTHVPGILEMIGMPYVGSGPMAHSLSLDKVVTKMILLQHGLPTPAFTVIDSPDAELPDLPYPMIVKPRNEAVSFGIKVCQDEAELRAAAQVIFDKFQQSVLAEQYIDGREVNVGVLGNSPPEALPPAELDFGDGPKVYSYEDKTKKSGREVEVVCPAKLDDDLRDRAQDIAVKAFKALGLFDCCRVDMRIDKDGQLYILETNSLPSLGEHGSYTHAAAASGLDFTALVNRLVEVASARYFGTPNPPALEKGARDPKQETFAFITGSRDKIEKAIREWTLVSSRTQDPLGLRAAHRRVGKILTDIGLTRQDAFSDEPAATCWSTSSGFDGGTLLVGHLDVPLALDASVPPFHREPEWLRGEGIGNSRAPLVMTEFALRALRRVRKLRGSKLGVFFYGDEGRDGEESRELLEAAMKRARNVLVLRPGSGGDKIITQRRGLRRYELVADSEPRRPGQQMARPELLRWLAARLEECSALSSKKERVSVSVGELRTTGFRALLPHRVRATLLVNYLDVTVADRVEEQIRKVLGKRDGHRWQLELGSDRPPLTPDSTNDALVAQLRAVGETWDIPVEADSSLLPSVAGLADSNTGVVCGVGPAATEMFTSQEAVQRISLVQRTLMLTQFLLDQHG